ncbi:MAG: gamma-glutamyltransferase, partial [Rhodobacterales bacterium]|nr:gamma-glutamyltransferase [Rhodobacterales bacterium]
FYFAGAASGGLAAPTALVSVAARNLLADQSLEAAMAAPRVHHGGAPDTLFHEAELPPAARDDLAARGHALAATGPLGLVNVLSCAQGIPPHPESCDARSDPRGFGLAATADQ